MESNWLLTSISIIFRAFQGVGGGGCFSLSQVIITDIVPPERYPKYVSQLSIVSSLALLCGPIVGGAISSHTTWRWIFIIKLVPTIRRDLQCRTDSFVSVPISSVALVLTIIGMPGHLGLGSTGDSAASAGDQKAFKATLARVDALESILLLFAVLSLTAAFEEADSEFPWKSAYVIVLLITSGGFWVILLLWERSVTQKCSAREPVLPWRFFTNPAMMAVLLYVEKQTSVCFRVANTSLVVSCSWAAQSSFPSSNFPNVSSWFMSFPG